MKKLNLFILILLVGFSNAFTQIETPQASPTTTLKQQIGLTDVEIVYSRPSMKGRTIFGDLVPYGVMWRTGANMSSKVTFSDAVKINGKDVPAGSYALYTIPNKESWTVILHTNTSYGGTGGDDYKESEDLMRFEVKPTTLGNAVETFTIDIENNQMDKSNISLSWDKTKVSFVVEAPVSEKIEKMISNTLNPGGTQYYRAATYYHESGKDLATALKYCTTAIEKYEAADMKPYWVVRRKSLIEADMKDYKAAIASAEKSLEWATAEKNADYVKMNEESIAQWKKMK